MFRDSIIGKQQQINFQIKNSSTNNIKFIWPNLTDFNFIPKIGHLRSGSSKTIQLSFFSEKPVKYNGIKALCQWQKINYDTNINFDWDDSMRILKSIPREDLNNDFFIPQIPQEDINNKPRSRNIKGQNSKKKISLPPIEVNNTNNKPIQIYELKPEPSHTIINSKTKDILVKIIAIADFIKFTISTNEISFAPTMIYQSRTVNVKITNNSQIRFEFIWNLESFECSSNTYYNPKSYPFIIEPLNGFIEGGQTMNFLVHFKPLEVDDFKGIFKCEIPYLMNFEPPKINLTGISKRPLCHFNVKTSDYISSGRRHPDYIDPLPENLQVIEISSLSIKNSSTLRFEIINTTSESYDAFWNQISGPKEVIKCETPIALLSSGKHYTIIFTYIPKSIKTIESLWEFSIPKHGIIIPILIVGKITPNV